MVKIINKIVFYAKVVLFLVAFSLSLYITFMKMDFTSSNLLTVLPIFIPFCGLLIVLVFDFFLNSVNNHLFYNISSLLSFIAIIIIALRTIFDHNIIAYPATINLNFFTFQEGKIKVLLYLLLINNLIFIYYDRRNKIKIHS